MKSKRKTVITPSAIRGMLGNDGEIMALGSDFMIARHLKVEDIGQLTFPFHFESYLTVFCKSGEIICNVNLSEYKLQKGMLLVVTPGNTVHVAKSQGADCPGTCLSIMNVAEGFLRDSESSTSNMLIEALTVLDNPCIRLSEAEISLLEQYTNIIRYQTASSAVYARESVRNLLMSVFYLFAGFMRNSPGVDTVQSGNIPTRQKTTFDRFLRLVYDNHKKERQMSFYADKLCVTPKYLSKVIKDVSGKSGPAWIDEFVMLSAKNLLKHSNKSIKEIAASLNFSSQTFFFRFFKNHSNMTPSQYRQM